MAAFFFGTLWLAASAEAACPPIDFDELQPPEGEEFVYSLWQDRQIQPSLYRVAITRSSSDEVRADTSYFLVNGQWSPPSPMRAVAGVILLNENEFNGTFPRQLNFRPLDPPIAERSLSVGDEVRLSAVETAELASGEIQRHEGNYVISHAGCGELIHEGETIRTRRLRAEYFRFLGQPEVGWTLTEGVQIYHIPVGANWFYALHREENHPMEQGTMIEGYTAP